MGYDTFKSLVDAKRSEDEHPEMVQARKAGEERARGIIAGNLGSLTPEQIEEVCRAANQDYSRGRTTHARFMPALIGKNRTDLAKNAPTVSKWIERLWRADDPERTLTEFWEEGEVPGAGKSLPTIVLYLRDPERFSPWVGVLHRAVEDLAGSKMRTERTGAAYMAFNEAVQRLRGEHSVTPEEMDLFLYDWMQEKKESGSQEETKQSAQGFNGFSPDAFRFFNDLSQNDTREWMDANRDRYVDEIREPLRQLAREIASSFIMPTLNADSPDPFETRIDRSHVMSVIQRNAFGAGDKYHRHMWFAFYRKSREKKFKDAQLFFLIRAEGIRFGFCVGQYARDVLGSFRKRVSEDPEQVWEVIESAGAHLQCRFLHKAEGDRMPQTPTEVAGPEGVLEWISHDDIDAICELGRDDPLVSSADLVDRITEVFKTVYPLFLTATGADWDTIRSVLEEVEGPDEPGPRYTDEQFCQEAYLERKTLNLYRRLLLQKPQLIFYGVPGTGKTFIALRLAKLLAEGDMDRVKLVQFHPSYAYEDFIEGIRPKSVEVGERMEISYPLVDGVFKTLCLEAARNRDQHFVLVIDEINRGNVSRVFGELMYLLEYRDEPMDLPYSNLPLTIPRNLYVIGTMNSADRSIALVDYALRRRFNFVELLPSSDVLQRWYEDNGVGSPEALGMFELLNEQLHEDGIGKHFLIGHSHFMLEDMDRETLESVWHHSVTPLLDEYFFNQDERLAKYGFDSMLEQARQRFEIEE